MINLHFRLVTFANPLPTPFLLVGSQLGALNSLAYANSHSQQVAHVVLIDPITQSIFEENNKETTPNNENHKTSWKHFWTKKQIPFSRFLQTTAFLGLNRMATLLGYLEVPGALPYETTNHSIEDHENMKNENDLTQNNLMLATMRLNHFMSDPSNLGAASLELGILTSLMIWI